MPKIREEKARGNGTKTSPTRERGNGAAKPARETRRQTILLVDDEEDILDSLKELFTGSLKGIEVRTARSGAQGLAMLRERPIDLIVTDYKMPGMNGLEFLREARRVAPATPRILITAFPDLAIAIQAINEASIENFITKPFESRQLIEIVRAVLLDRRTKELWNESFARAMSRTNP